MKDKYRLSSDYTPPQSLHVHMLFRLQSEGAEKPINVIAPPPQGHWSKKQIDGSMHAMQCTQSLLSPTSFYHIYISATLRLINYISLPFSPSSSSRPVPQPTPLQRNTRIECRVHRILQACAIHLSASIPSPSPSPSPHGLNLILPGRGMETPRSQLRPAPAPGPISNQGRPGGLLDVAGLACT